MKRSVGKRRKDRFFLVGRQSDREEKTRWDSQVLLLFCLSFVLVPRWAREVTVRVCVCFELALPFEHVAVLVYSYFGVLWNRLWCRFCFDLIWSHRNTAVRSSWLTCSSSQLCVIRFGPIENRITQHIFYIIIIFIIIKFLIYLVTFLSIFIFHQISWQFLLLLFFETFTVI